MRIMPINNPKSEMREMSLVGRSRATLEDDCCVNSIDVMLFALLSSTQHAMCHSIVPFLKNQKIKKSHENRSIVR